ncbi:hypothetical protein CDIK_2435 [Cucumispora dikerogammari]|nr:hypothetical protein CDIK_2435 [Cucumispora dikerogammari]
MFDREMCIINSVNQIAPFCSRAFCVRHIAKNLRSSFGDNIGMGYYWRSVNTYSTDEINNQMIKLQLHNQPFYQRVSDIGVLINGSTPSFMFPDLVKISTILPNQSIPHLKSMLVVILQH